MTAEIPATVTLAELFASKVAENDLAWAEDAAEAAFRVAERVNVPDRRDPRGS